MQTFLDSKHLALEKRLDELNQKDVNFELPNETETGSAEEQPGRDKLVSGNNEEGELSSSSFSNYLLRDA